MVSAADSGMMDIAREIEEYRRSKKQAERLLEDFSRARAAGEISEGEYQARVLEMTGGLSKEAFLRSYDDYIADLQRVAHQPITEKSAVVPKPMVKKKWSLFGSPLRKEFSSELDRESFDRFVKARRSRENVDVVLAKYVLYQPSKYGAFSNRLFGSFSLSLTKEYPEFFRVLFADLRSADFGILSKTYVSMILLSSLIAVGVGVLGGLFLFNGIVMRIVNSLLLGIVLGVITFVVMYYYPGFIIRKKRASMKADLPFVTVHMAAVAGSGAQPISMFNLVLSAGEYKGLEPEIKKVLNYVNLFGYDLTTALRLVASTTPLRSFNELLSGMVTTIETGGDLKSYLEIKAKEFMDAYEDERKRFTETLATFSDIYIGISLAAPMMLFVLLSIINTPILGGTIAGLSAGALATLGTFVVIPIMNIIFIILIDALQPA